MINSPKRNLLFSIKQGSQYFLCSECMMDLRWLLRIWLLIYKRQFQVRRSSSGVCNLQDIFMVVTGIKMAVACLTSPLRNPRYLLKLSSQCLLVEVSNLSCYSINFCAAQFQNNIKSLKFLVLFKSLELYEEKQTTSKWLRIKNKMLITSFRFRHHSKSVFLCYDIWKSMFVR